MRIPFYKSPTFVCGYVDSNKIMSVAFSDNSPNIDANLIDGSKVTIYFTKDDSFNKTKLETYSKMIFGESLRELYPEEYI